MGSVTPSIQFSCQNRPKNLLSDPINLFFLFLFLLLTSPVLGVPVHGGIPDFQGQHYLGAFSVSVPIILISELPRSFGRAFLIHPGGLLCLHEKISDDRTSKSLSSGRSNDTSRTPSSISSYMRCIKHRYARSYPPASAGGLSACIC